MTIDLQLNVIQFIVSINVLRDMTLIDMMKPLHPLHHSERPQAAR